MIKKKILFSLGSLSLMSPVLFTISCGKIVHEEDRTLLSKEARKVMEKDWQRKVLVFEENTITKTILQNHYLKNDKKNKELIRIIEKYLSKKIRNNKNWLRTKSDQIIKNNSEKTIQIEKGLFNENFRFKNIDFKSEKNNYKNKIINTIDLLWTMEDGEFQREIYKIMVVRKYLEEANKEKYLKLNNQTEEDLVGLEKKYDENSFALIKIAMDKKMLLKWEVSTNNLHSLKLIDRDKKNFEEIQKYIQWALTEEILNFSSTQKKLAKQFDLSSLATKHEENMLSFSGIYEQDKSSINLDIMESDKKNELLEKMKNSSNLKGFVYKNEIITEGDGDKKIELIPDGEEQIKVTYVKFLLPEYNTESQKIIFNSGIKEEMLDLISTYHADTIYETAKKWFRSKLNKTKKAIILKVVNEKYKKWLIEEQQFKLAKEFEI